MFAIKLTSSPPPPAPIDQVKILHPSVDFELILISAACKILYSDSDWLQIRTQNQVNILPPKLIGSNRMSLSAALFVSRCIVFQATKIILKKINLTSLEKFNFLQRNRSIFKLDGKVENLTIFFYFWHWFESDF